MGGEFQFGKSTEPLKPFRKQLSFIGNLYHPSGPKSDPHTCSDMWLTGAPMYNPKPGTYNTVGLKHGSYWKSEKEYQMSNVYLSILHSMGVGVEGFSDSTGTLSGSIFSKT